MSEHNAQNGEAVVPAIKARPLSDLRYKLIETDDANTQHWRSSGHRFRHSSARARRSRQWRHAPIRIDSSIIADLLMPRSSAMVWGSAASRRCPFQNKCFVALNLLARGQLDHVATGVQNLNVHCQRATASRISPELKCKRRSILDAIDRLRVAPKSWYVPE
jgi:hypothetical protein